MNIELMITEFFTTYAYQPFLVYTAIVIIMTASSFGLPFPEEFTLVSAGLIAYMGMHPDKYPPPLEGGDPVNVYTLATVCFVAVLGSDVLIYAIGRYMGPKVFDSKFFKEKIGVKHIDKIHTWFQKWGMWVCGIFRFTPGIRFPGHLSCGAMGVKWWQFLAVDGFAALVSVPTQVILVAFYGEIITSKFKEFKIILFSLLAIVAIVYFVRKKLQKPSPVQP
jgi:membrane protein DedA with SNARE-associated domain